MLLLTLLGIPIGKVPVVHFSLDDNNAGGVFTFGTNTVLDLGLLGKHAVKLESKDANGIWHGVGQSAGGGLLELVLLGEKSGTVSFPENLPAGEYRASIVNTSLLSVGLGQVTLSVDGFTEIEVVTGTQESEGNFIDLSAAVGDEVTGREITTVNFNGEIHPVIGGSATTIIGDYGTLEINANGAYTYTPKAEVGNAGTDSFTVTVQSADGYEDSSNLIVSVTQNGGTMFAISSDFFILGQSDEMDLADVDTIQYEAEQAGENNLGLSTGLSFEDLLSDSNAEGFVPLPEAEEKQVFMAASADNGAANIAALDVQPVMDPLDDLLDQNHSLI
ncbi:MAG: Ig-like domain-containing protein [Pseudomonas sp.]|nr:Ig-like domain-containing protein [Pseudomonas sp.]